MRIEPSGCWRRGHPKTRHSPSCAGGWHSRRDPATARHFFQIAYDADEDHREALSGLIAALVALGDTKTAAPLRSIAAKRERLNALIHRAGSRVARDDSRTLPEDADLPRLLGDACAAVHHDDEARGWYKLAIARDPLDARAQQALYELNLASQNTARSTRPAP